LVTLLAVSGLLAQAGTAGLAFLKTGVGGRALAMGEAGVASSTDPSSVYYNPASLALSGSSQILLMHQAWIQDAHTEFLGASTSSGSFHLGLGVVSSAVDDIEVRTAPGAPLSTFSSRNASIGLSMALELSPEVSVGATGKLLYEKIFVDDATGFALDLGGIYHVDSSLTLGASLNNLGSMSELRNESSKLPTIFRAGASYATPLESLESIVTASADIVSLSAEGSTHLHLGAEAEFRRMFSVRAGYQSGYDNKSVSMGVGVRQGMLRFDYAFVPFSMDLGSTHTLALLFTFD
jgi:hypothetical protein